MVDNKKKRSSNYTAAEKEMLLELIKRYHHIIENKETTAQMVHKKRETWEFVCQQYNAVAVSGSRTWQQLRHLHENLKQRSKNYTARAYHLQFYEKYKETLDQAEIRCNRDGAYKSSFPGGQDEETSALEGCQNKPLSNPDDAALYFGDHNKTMTNINWITTDNELCTVTSIIAGQEDIKITKEKNSQKPSTDTSTVTINIKDDPEIPEVTTANMNQDHNKLETLTLNTKRKTKPQRHTNNIKQQYFKIKLRNAKLEHRYLINRNKMEMNKYKIEMQILQLKLQKLQSSS